MKRLLRFYDLRVPEYETLDEVPADLKRAVFWCKFISDGIGSEELARFAESNGMTKELEMAEQAYNEILETFSLSLFVKYVPSERRRYTSPLLEILIEFIMSVSTESCKSTAKTPSFHQEALILQQWHKVF